jgi:hypothetical protein
MLWSVARGEAERERAETREKQKSREEQQSRGEQKSREVKSRGARATDESRRQRLSGTQY